MLLCCVLLCCRVLLPQADETLAKFLDFCTYGHMIDNVVLIVTGTLHERDVQVGVGHAGGGSSPSLARSQFHQLAQSSPFYLVRVST